MQIIVVAIFLILSCSVWAQFGIPPVFNEPYGREVGSVKAITCQNPNKYGFVGRYGTDEYYLISDVLLTWTDGENYCQKYGAHLPSVSNINDVNYLRCNLFIFKHFSCLYTLQSTFIYWLGLYLSIPSQTWKWADGSSSTFRNWGPGNKIWFCFFYSYSLSA